LPCQKQRNDTSDAARVRTEKTVSVKKETEEKETKSAP
jgi:hypothetical protein